VHQIRNHIEAARDPKSGYVLAISSPYEGDGKTNMVMGLGWSYATTGTRTLLVDCDMAGRALTRQTGTEARSGLKELLNGRSADGLIVKLPAPNLSVLPVGCETAIGAEMIRTRDLERVLARARDEFEMIIVDTGPLATSLEGLPVAAAADGVLLSVRRGRKRAGLEQCIHGLGRIGAHYLGVVLNCADRSDCNRYASRSGSSRVTSEGSTSDIGISDTTWTTNDGESLLIEAMKAVSEQRKHERPEDASKTEEGSDA
jgi:Mrp family chromosome partitioning ATPase